MTLTADSFSPKGWAGYLAFKAKYAEPDTLDFRCPWCKAEPGQLCPGRPRGHTQRRDRMIRARQEWEYDAVNSGINAQHQERLDYLHRSGYRCTTDNYLKFMWRNKARIRRPGEPAATIAFGAWLLAHTSRVMPLAYLGIRPRLRADMGVDEVKRLVDECAGGDPVAYDALDQATRDWARITQPGRKN